ncbi:protein quiver-like [Gigantopelta aegis]|uniref:protein quiver-like n=1 Tax=Gigantopelta aegis TaxID=1735272 RepID=UPI001B88C7BA|nr:protein quiver-like [Gigantopelta aegis]
MILVAYLILAILPSTQTHSAVLPSADTRRVTPCPKADGYVHCYICTSVAGSDDHHCGDPFNATSHNTKVTIKTCKGYCAKWITDSLSGSLRITRMCSSALKMNMLKDTVCMRERGSENGQLCFCDQDFCNSVARHSTSLLNTAVLLYSGFLLSFFGHS